jgi:hypothetical protein
MSKKKTEIPWESIGLVEPPDRLDERVAGVIAAARIQRSVTRRVVPVWVFAAACSACLVLGFVTHRLMLEVPRTQRVPAVVIEISPDDLPPEFFVIEKSGKATFFERQLSEVEIEFQTAAGRTES